MVTGQRELNLVHEILVGRDSACEITSENNTISRKRARVFTAEGRVYVEDLGSQKGTLGNENRVEMPAILRSGDEIVVGDIRFRLKF